MGDKMYIGELLRIATEIGPARRLAPGENRSFSRSKMALDAAYLGPSVGQFGVVTIRRNGIPNQQELRSRDGGLGGGLQQPERSGVHNGGIVNQVVWIGPGDEQVSKFRSFSAPSEITIVSDVFAISWLAGATRSLYSSKPF